MAKYTSHTQHKINIKQKLKRFWLNAKRSKKWYEGMKSKIMDVLKILICNFLQRKKDDYSQKQFKKR